MIQKKGEKYFVDIENQFELFLANCLLKKKGTLFFRKKIETASRIRKEQQKKDKDNIWLSLIIDNSEIKEKQLFVNGVITNHWLKKSCFIFSKDSSFQIIPKNKVDPLLEKFIIKKEKDLYVIFFFHELLKVILIKNNTCSTWLKKEFQYDAYYIDIKKYLVPLLERIKSIESKEMLLYTSALINEDLRLYLPQYKDYQIVLGNEEEEVYNILNNKKKIISTSILKDCNSINLLYKYILNATPYSHSATDLYLCKKPINIFIIPSLFSSKLQQYYEYLLMFYKTIVIINTSNFKYSYYMPEGIFIVYHD